jgi:hypothetical protein
LRSHFRRHCYVGLGFLSTSVLMKRKLVKGFPWGYYADQVPQGDPQSLPGQQSRLLHDTGTSFGGLESFGDYGEFSGLASSAVW